MEAKMCFRCESWWVPYTTRITRPGWWLCSQCHDCPWSNDFTEIPWEYRRIRLLGPKGNPKWQRLHTEVLKPKLHDGPVH
jgi:hypothetical protein